MQDPPAYYSEGNFMSYSNGVRAYIDRAEDGYKHRTMTRFHQHQLAAVYQLAAFQHALAIARFSPWDMHMSLAIPSLRMHLHFRLQCFVSSMI